MEHSIGKENTPLNSTLSIDHSKMLAATKPSSSTNEITNLSISPLPFQNHPSSCSSSFSEESSSVASTPSIMMHSPSIINLMSPNSLFSLTPPHQKSFQNNGNLHGDNNNNHKTPRPSLTPPAPPNSEKLTMAIKLVESTLDEAIEDVRRVICIQEEEEAVRMEKQLLLLEEEVVAEEDAAKNRVARKYEAVG